MNNRSEGMFDRDRQRKANIFLVIVGVVIGAVTTAWVDDYTISSVRGDHEVSVNVLEEKLVEIRFDLASARWSAEEERLKREQCEFNWQYMVDAYSWCEEIVVGCGRECVNKKFGPSPCENVEDCEQDTIEYWCSLHYEAKDGPEYFPYTDDEEIHRTETDNVKD